MESYLRVVGQAVLVFPVAAALIALPFLIHHYRKYGGMTFARFFLSYSFVLYALCAYFLVILPLPDREAVAQMTGSSVQLLPFSFFRDLSKETGFQLAEPSTYLPALLSTFTLQFVFNIALLMPLGFYLRYYFRRKLLPAVLVSLGVSLFFELTQLSGLYGYYPRAYRLFDVDDLLCNTLGGFLGYVLTGPLMKILPDRDKIDEKSYQKGERVTFTRRCLSLFVDMIFVSLLGTVLSIFLSQLPFNLPFALAYLLYFGLFQGLWGGKSLGKRLTKICVVNQDGSRVLLWRCLLRYGLLVAFIYCFFAVAEAVFLLPASSGFAQTFLRLLWFMVGFFALLVESARNSVSKIGRDYLYGRLSGTRLASTVLRQPLSPHLHPPEKGSPPMEHSLELQKFHYFDEGNTYAGQKTKDPDSGLLLRYLVEPDKEAALLRAYAWTEDLCFERAHDKLQKELPLSEEGLEQALAWLEEQYAAL